MHPIMSEFLRHQECLACGSSDGNAFYTDGHTYCFVCQNKTYPEDFELTEENEGGLELVSEDKGMLRPLVKLAPIGKPAPFRGMKRDTIAFYKVTVPEADGRTEAVYPFYDKDGKHIANKTRFKGKEFKIDGEWRSAVLFGQQLFPAGSAKQITLTEGQDDAMAAYEMQGSRFPCVSVASASSAVKDVRTSYEYLNSFDNIVIAFDNDDPGKAAAKAVAGMFKPGKCRIMHMTKGKDANEYLQNGLTSAFTKEWWDAEAFKPDGLKLGSEMWGEIREPKKYETVNYPWAGLNKATYGIRLSEFVLLTAQTKVGKTAILKEIISSIRDETEQKDVKPGIGMMFLEESNYDSSLGLMSVVANKRLHLPDVREQTTEQELREYFDKAVNSERLVLWDHFGSNAIDEVLNKIRHMHNMGCKYIVLDHLSILVSDQSGDERKQLDEISTKLKMLCMELNIAVIAVIHQNRNNQIRSSAGPEQIANITLKLHREMEDPDEWRRNVTRVSVQLNRFSGTTGPCCWLYYDPDTGRLTEMDEKSVAKYEKLKPEAKAPEDWNK